MTTNIREFARALDRAARRMVDAPLLRAKQDIARTALSGFIERTPSVTGHARANWQVTVGSPATGVVAGADPSGGVTMANGVAAIMADSGPFATVWIVNNAPYIQALEQGSATQAPASIVAVTLAELPR